MKVEVIKSEEQEIKYPCLMEATSGSGLIVFMVSEGNGFVVVGDKDYHRGHCSGFWDMSEFKPFTGKLVLSNE